MKRNRASASFMTRLGRDQRGNTIAIVAAAIVPLLGMIGGGIDMSRLYLAKTRLQQACDAGALAGRRAMGSGSWSENTATSSEGRAEELFRANFASGAYGTTLVGREFTEDDGTVNGTATVSVPMSVMRIFGMQTRNLTVTCTAKMEIPNTDVMFVLDVTGSMNCATSGSCPGGNNGNTPATNAKIFGLKSAVKCFYEALLRVNTSEVCGENDPTATTYAGTAQIRLGFMPYSVNVNVGKLLPNTMLADQWTYQSREGVNETIYTWSLGDAYDIGNYGNWQISGAINSSIRTTNGYNSFSTVPNESYTLSNGQSYARQVATANTTTKCSALNKFGGGTQIAGTTDTYSNPSDATYTATDNTPPTHPNVIQNQQVRQTRTATVTTGYRYRYFKIGNSWSCWLEYASKKSSNNTYTQERLTTAKRPVTWTERLRVKWTYKPVSFNVSGLKAGGATWNNSISLPIGQTDGISANPSGSNDSAMISVLDNTDVVWDGCIEERQTVKNSDKNPSDEWTSIPQDAYDLNIDMVPSASTANSHWGPMLGGAVWGRYADLDGDGDTEYSYNSVETWDDLNQNMEYYCTTEAKKLQPWTAPGPFETYVNSLSGIGNTYHDIGLIWGARFISPTGIFADDNAETSTGGAIQRHIIFMTDGTTMTANTNYAAHGLHWWDRRQTTYAPSSNNLNDILNARLPALCALIKSRNITLWVVSYGGGIDEATETRLEACATEGKYFSATDTPTLISNFQQIASEIADLRLTS